MRDLLTQYDDGAALPRRLTGRMVLLCLVGFFGVVFGVNGILVHEALSTFGGVDTDSAYQAGRKFEQDVAMAKAQDAPGRYHGSAEIPPGQWDLVIELSRQGDRLFRSRNRVVLK
jgi:nitrogen fixation protein FixH